MNYSAIKDFDIANGPGVRVSLFVSGCTRHCAGCFNSDTWDFNAGQLFTPDTAALILDKLSVKTKTGLSILGGEPFELQNIGEVRKLVEAANRHAPDKTIWAWTGYTYEELFELAKHNVDIQGALRCIDVLVDGPFKLENKELLRFRGSTNQRFIDVKKSMPDGVLAPVPVEWHDEEIYAHHWWPGTTLNEVADAD